MTNIDRNRLNYQADTKLKVRNQKKKLSNFHVLHLTKENWRVFNSEFDGFDAELAGPSTSQLFVSGTTLLL